MGDERQRQYRRVGDTAKCPACGVPMDSEAYRCPRCLIYFCFKCRRRVQQRDPQFQCMNQRCGQYGKMLCNACIVEVPVMGDRSWQELVEAGKNVPLVSSAGMWVVRGMAMLMGIGYFAIINAWEHTVVGDVVIWVLAPVMVIFGLIHLFIENQTKYKQPVYRTVTENVEVGRSKCCIACRQAVEHLR